MKEITISGAVLALLFCLCAITSHHTESVINEVLKNISLCEESIETENWGFAEKAANKAISHLKKHSKTLQSYILHSALEEITLELATLKVSIEEKEKLPAKSNARLIKERLLSILDSDKIILSNIL